MPRKIISFLLEKEIGVSEEAVGPETIDKAIQKRMETCKISGIGEYLDYIHAHPGEISELAELTVIPETWFFRNEAAFDCLAEYVQIWRKNAAEDSIFRILCIPCSTGEEVWSLAITLAEAGIPESAFHIDAVDVSRAAVERGRAGIYGQESFRKEGYAHRHIYFSTIGKRFQVRDSLRKNICFLQGNLIDKGLLGKEKPYHIVFCRNLLIYFSVSAKNIAVRNIERLLEPGGIVFLGHAEQGMFRNPGFIRLPCPRSFAWKKAEEAMSAQLPEPQIFSAQKKQKQQYPVQEKAKETPALQKTRTVPILPEISEKTETVQYQEAAPEPFAVQDFLEKARMLADRGKLDEAFKQCRICLEENPFSAAAHFLMGMIYHAVGNDRETEAYMDKVIYLEPGHQDALEHLYLIAQHRGDLRRAELLRQRIRRLPRKEDAE
ncbi:MAG: CheR family methyltransferase [Desulfococcaceae bacterium]